MLHNMAAHHVRTFILLFISWTCLPVITFWLMTKSGIINIFSDVTALIQNLKTINQLLEQKEITINHLLFTSIQERVHILGNLMTGDKWWAQPAQWRWHIFWLFLYKAALGNFFLAFTIYRLLISLMMITGWMKLLDRSLSASLVLLSPSWWLWNSLPLKESLLFVMAGMIFATFTGKYSKWYQFTLTAIFFTLGLWIRPYYTLLLIPIAFLILIAQRINTLLVLTMLVLISLATLTYTAFSYDPICSYLGKLQERFSASIGRYSCSIIPLWKDHVNCAMYIFLIAPSQGICTLLGCCKFSLWMSNAMLLFAEAFLVLASIPLAIILLTLNRRIRILFTGTTLWLLIALFMGGATVNNSITLLRYLSPVFWSIELILLDGLNILTQDKRYIN